MLALVFTGAWTEVLGCIESIGGLAVLLGLYRFAECHQEGCHRLGRFKLGHLRLCRVHHPQVPNDGKIGAQHIETVARNLSCEHTP